MLVAEAVHDELLDRLFHHPGDNGEVVHQRAFRQIMLKFFLMAGNYLNTYLK